MPAAPGPTNYYEDMASVCLLVISLIEEEGGGGVVSNIISKVTISYVKEVLSKFICFYSSLRS